MSRSASCDRLCFAPKCLVVALINVVYGTCPRYASVAIVFGHLAECAYLGRRLAIVYVSRRSALSWHQSTWCMAHAHVAHPLQSSLDIWRNVFVSAGVSRLSMVHDEVSCRGTNQRGVWYMPTLRTRCSRLWTSGGMFLSRSAPHDRLCFAPRCRAVSWHQSTWCIVHAHVARPLQSSLDSWRDALISIIDS